MTDHLYAVRDRGAIEVTSRGGGGRVMGTVVLVLPGSPSVPFGPAVSSRSSTSEPESLTKCVKITDILLKGYTIFGL